MNESIDVVRGSLRRERRRPLTSPSSPLPAVAFSCVLCHTSVFGRPRRRRRTTCVCTIYMLYGVETQVFDGTAACTLKSAKKTGGQLSVGRCGANRNSF